MDASVDECAWVLHLAAGTEDVDVEAVTRTGHGLTADGGALSASRLTCAARRHTLSCVDVLAGDELVLAATAQPSGTYALRGPLASQVWPFARRLADTTPAQLLSGAETSTLHARIDLLPAADPDAVLPDGTFDNRRRADGTLQTANPLFRPWAAGTIPDLAAGLVAHQLRGDTGRDTTVALAELWSLQPAVNPTALHWMADHPAVVDVAVQLLPTSAGRWLADGTHRAVLAQLAGVTRLPALESAPAPA